VCELIKDGSLYRHIPEGNKENDERPHNSWSSILGLNPRPHNFYARLQLTRCGYAIWGKNETIQLKIRNINQKSKVKISLCQAVEAHRVARG
jgi:hypothetical protein